MLKGKLKTWSWEVFGDVDKILLDIEAEISRLDVEAENEVLSEEEVGLRKAKFVEL